MDRDKNNQHWLTEFTEFVETPLSDAPSELGRNIRSYVIRELNPNPWGIFTKISFVQVITGFVTLLFCPQFGLSFTQSHGLLHLLMKYGEAVCMFGCGVLFVGSSLFVSSLILKRDEVRVLRKNRLLQTAVLSFLTVGTFLCFGAEVIGPLTLAWLAGSILGGIATLEMGSHLRKWGTKVIYA